MCLLSEGDTNSARAQQYLGSVAISLLLQKIFDVASKRVIALHAVDPD